MQRADSDRVLVTGVGAVTPLGVGARTLHERWSAGACGVREGEAPCADFEPTDFLTAKAARRADRFTQLALAACALWGVVVERIAVRPFVARGSNSWLIATVALGICGWWMSADPKTQTLWSAIKGA